MYKWWVIYRKETAYKIGSVCEKRAEIPLDDCNSREEAISKADAFWESLSSQDKEDCVELTVMFTDDRSWGEPDYAHTQDELILYGKLSHSYGVGDIHPVETIEDHFRKILPNMEFAYDVVCCQHLDWKLKAYSDDGNCYGKCDKCWKRPYEESLRRDGE